MCVLFLGETLNGGNERGEAIEGTVVQSENQAQVVICYLWFLPTSQGIIMFLPTPMQKNNNKIKSSPDSYKRGNAITLNDLINASHDFQFGDGTAWLPQGK